MPRKGNEDGTVIWMDCHMQRHRPLVSKPYKQRLPCISRCDTDVAMSALHINLFLALPFTTMLATISGPQSRS